MASAELSEDLARLADVSRVLIRERAGAGCKYVVLSPEGAELLHATETSGIVSKVLAGQSRAFEIDVRDNNSKVVMKLRRPYAVGGEKMDVSLGGQLAAVVRQEMTFLKPVLSISSAADQPQYRVKGPVSISANCDFDLYSCDKKRVGAIRRRWRGGAAAGGSAGDRDSFVVSFPPDAPLHHRAAIIGTAFLIDFLFYL